MKMHPGENLHPGANLLHLCGWCKFSGANYHPGAHLPGGGGGGGQVVHINATCYHICTV